MYAELEFEIVFRCECFKKLEEQNVNFHLKEKINHKFEVKVKGNYSRIWHSGKAQKLDRIN